MRVQEGPRDRSEARTPHGGLERGQGQRCAASPASRSVEDDDIKEAPSGVSGREMPPWPNSRRLRVEVKSTGKSERGTRKTGWSTSRPGRVSEGKFPGKKREGDASSLREYRVAAATRYTSRTCRKLDTAHLSSQTVNTHTHLLFIYN